MLFFPTRHLLKHIHVLSLKDIVLYCISISLYVIGLLDRNAIGHIGLKKVEV